MTEDVLKQIAAANHLRAAVALFLEAYENSYKGTRATINAEISASFGLQDAAKAYDAVITQNVKTTSVLQ
jgi:hypothetical protein